jgi:asparagine synthase (glutamine-hydrolysing)
MCGIFAMVSPRGTANSNTVKKALDRLAHRGPDGRGTWICPDRIAALGHTRLSIIGLESGGQPISNESDDLHLIANGEFYDHDRLTTELTARGHQFRTRSDSEIALHRYEEAGPECLPDLRGEFAFVIWDARKRTLFAARDRFGIKPLFYTELASGDVLIASEVKALFAAGAPAAWDEAGMYQALHFAQLPDQSLYHGIKQLPPGHFMEVRDGKVTVQRYWEADYPTRRHLHTPSPTAEDEIAETAKLLETATALRTRADVPIGCYLSGGIDSSAVLAMAKRLSGKPVTAFSVSFDHPDYDESNAASEMARYVGAHYHQVDVTGSDFAEAFHASVCAGEILQYNGHGPARYLLSQAVNRAGIKTVLGGEGADELFAGYGFVKRSLSAPPKSSFAVLRNLMRFANPRAGKGNPLSDFSPFAARIADVFGLSPSLLDELSRTIPLYRDLLHPDFLERHCNRDPYRAFSSRVRPWKLLGREPSKALTSLWMKSHFTNYVLAGERLDMAHAVEVRLPFLDHHLFAYLRTLPASLLNRNQQNKYLLRQAVGNAVTPNVLQGAKKPFFAPPSARTAGNPMHDLVQDLLRSANFSSVPFFDQTAVIQLLDRLPKLPGESAPLIDPVLYLLASTATLQNHYSLT